VLLYCCCCTLKQELIATSHKKGLCYSPPSLRTLAPRATSSLSSLSAAVLAGPPLPLLLPLLVRCGGC
jgi:hypothetical protein